MIKWHTGSVIALILNLQTYYRLLQKCKFVLLIVTMNALYNLNCAENTIKSYPSNYDQFDFQV